MNESINLSIINHIISSTERKSKITKLKQTSVATMYLIRLPIITQARRPIHKILHTRRNTVYKHLSYGSIVCKIASSPVSIQTQAIAFEWKPGFRLHHFTRKFSDRNLQNPGEHSRQFPKRGRTCTCHAATGLIPAQPTADLVINAAVGCYYFPPGPRLPSQLHNSTKLYCLVTEAHVCEQLAQSKWNDWCVFPLGYKTNALTITPRRPSVL